MEKLINDTNSSTAPSGPNDERSRARWPRFPASLRLALAVILATLALSTAGGVRPRSAVALSAPVSGSPEPL